jgi:hypothetical protein
MAGTQVNDAARLILGNESSARPFDGAVTDWLSLVTSLITNLVKACKDKDPTQLTAALKESPSTRKGLAYRFAAYFQAERTVQSNLGSRHAIGRDKFDQVQTDLVHRLFGAASRVTPDLVAGVVREVRGA